MAQKVIVPQKKNYVPQFLKQRDINSYFTTEIGRNTTLPHFSKSQQPAPSACEGKGSHFKFFKS